MIEAKQVSTFLTHFISVMNDRGLTLWDSRKNNDFLFESGFAKEDVEDIIRGLLPRNYCRGPENDVDPRRPNGEIWVFHQEFEGFELYMKLKLGTTGRIVAECLSVHEAEAEMKRPLGRRR